MIFNVHKYLSDILQISKPIPRINITNIKNGCRLSFSTWWISQVQPHQVTKASFLKSVATNRNTVQEKELEKFQQFTATFGQSGWAETIQHANICAQATVLHVWGCFCTISCSSVLVKLLFATIFQEIHVHWSGMTRSENLCTATDRQYVVEGLSLDYSTHLLVLCHQSWNSIRCWCNWKRFIRFKIVN